MPAGLYLYIPNTEEAYKRAVQAGGQSLYESRDMEYGDREPPRCTSTCRMWIRSKNALRAGATSLSERKDQFYGERNGGVMDEWGNHWYVATYKQSLTREELEKRASAQGR